MRHTPDARWLLEHLSITLALSCAFGTIAVASPQSSDPKPHAAVPADIEGREWSMHRDYGDQQQSWPRPGATKDADPSIAFIGGAIQGSPGCGRLTGEYRRSGDQLLISAKWADSTAKPCNQEARLDVAEFLAALLKVRRIVPEPARYRSDAMWLEGNKGKVLIDLSPRRAGADLSEFSRTFWQLAKLEGVNKDFSNIIIEIEERDVTFSAPAYSASFPFRYRLAGLEFFPAWRLNTDPNAKRLSQDREIGAAFKRVLHQINSYELHQGTLAFANKSGQPVLVLTSLHSDGIENRWWHIARFRDPNAAEKDATGLTEAKVSASLLLMNGRADGTPGCGSLGGKYTLTGDRLTFDASWALAGLCGNSQMAQNEPLITAFKGDLQIEKQGVNILLRDSSGNARVVLVPF